MPSTRFARQRAALLVALVAVVASGLLAVPIVGEDGQNYGLLQVSDKVDGTAFDEEDERRLQRLASLGALALDALARVRRLRVGEEVPILEHEAMADFVHIESV